MGSAGAGKVEGAGTAGDGGKVVESTSTPGRTYPPAFDVHIATACMLLSVGATGLNEIRPYL